MYIVYATSTYTIDLASHESFLHEMLTSADLQKYYPSKVSRYNMVCLQVEVGNSNS